MRKAAFLLTHLACVLAGWGIFSAAAPVSKDSTEREPTEESPRAREMRVRRDAEILLERLRAGLSEPESPSSDGEVLRELSVKEERDLRGPGDRDMVSTIRSQIAPMIHGIHGADLAYAFRHGQMKDMEILEHVASRFPELNESRLLIKAFLDELGPIAPRYVDGLLALLPPDERDQAIFDIYRDGLFRWHPEQLTEFLDLAFSHSSSVLEDSGGLERMQIYRLYLAWGDSYPAWLLDQAHGKGRNVLLTTLLEVLVSTDPPAAELLREEMIARSIPLTR